METDKSYINKKTVVAFVLGVFVAFSLYHAYVVYQLRADVNAIINLLSTPQVQQPATQTGQ